MVTQNNHGGTIPFIAKPSHHGAGCNTDDKAMGKSRHVITTRGYFGVDIGEVTGGP